MLENGTIGNSYKQCDYVHCSDGLSTNHVDYPKGNKKDVYTNGKINSRIEQRKYKRNKKYINNLDYVLTSENSTPNRASSTSEVTSNFHVTGLCPAFIF